MKCPYCSVNRDRVVDSRESREGATIRRRRECLACNRRFTSYEQIESIPYVVIKADGRREEFDHQKLLGGLLKACEKRPIPMKRLEDLVSAIEQTLHQKEEREISTREIGGMIMDGLRDLDPVAFVRFASVYRSFEDVGEFVDEVESLLSAELEHDAHATAEDEIAERGTADGETADSETSPREPAPQ